MSGGLRKRKLLEEAKAEILRTFREIREVLARRPRAVR